MSAQDRPQGHRGATQTADRSPKAGIDEADRDALAKVRAKVSEWEQIGRNFKRENPVISATIRNIMFDLRAVLDPEKVSDDE